MPKLFERLGPPRTTRAERELSLVNPMRQLDARERYRCVSERFEAQHRSAAAFDRAMILLNDVVQVARGPASAAPAEFAGLLEFRYDFGIGRVPVHIDHPRPRMPWCT